MPVRFKKQHPCNVRVGKYVTDAAGNHYKVEGVSFHDLTYFFRCEGGKTLKARYDAVISVGEFDPWEPRPDLKYRDDPVRFETPVRRAPRILPNGVVLMDGEAFNAREDNDER
ncbi:hypothetical protein MED16_gp42 [Pantoea phage vB_PagS_MED16]|nr:hypothetical protein MED16_gp42 [Pantoea phage vB_PagS_MED16]